MIVCAQKWKEFAIPVKAYEFHAAANVTPFVLPAQVGIIADAVPIKKFAALLAHHAQETNLFS